MPRNSVGVYTLPLPEVVSGEIVESVWANTTMDDIGSALTNSLSRNGEGGMLAPFRFADGTEAAPGAAWENAPGTGFFRTSSELAATWNASQIWSYNALGITLEPGAEIFSSTTPSGPNSLVPLGYLDSIFSDPAGLTLDGPLYVNGAVNFSGEVFGTLAPALGTSLGDWQVNAVFTTPDSNMERLVIRSFRVVAGAAHDTAVTMVQRFVDVTPHAFLALATGDTAFPVGWGLGYGSGAGSTYQMYGNVDGRVFINAPTGGTGSTLRVGGGVGTNHITCNDGTHNFDIYLGSGGTILNNTTAHDLTIRTDNTERAVFGSTGGFTLRTFGSTGSGMWYSSLANATVVFTGMEAGTDAQWRIYAVASAQNILTFTLAGGAATFIGTVNAPSFNVTSLRSMKQDIVPVHPGALDRIMDFDIYEYSYKNDTHKHLVIGVMADETSHRYSDGITVSTNNVLFDSVEALKELNRKVDRLTRLVVTGD